MRNHKRLTLKPETIRALQPAELADVAGGISGVRCDVIYSRHPNCTSGNPASWACPSGPGVCV